MIVHRKLHTDRQMQEQKRQKKKKGKPFVVGSPGSISSAGRKITREQEGKGEGIRLLFLQHCTQLAPPQKKRMALEQCIGDFDVLAPLANVDKENGKFRLQGAVSEWLEAGL